MNYLSAPNGWGPIWQRYIENGILPGSFGEALLTNDLSRAVITADYKNINLIPQHMMWLLEHMPFEAWGSIEAVEKWNKQGGLNGK